MRIMDTNQCMIRVGGGSDMDTFKRSAEHQDEGSQYSDAASAFSSSEASSAFKSAQEGHFESFSALDSGEEVSSACSGTEVLPFSPAIPEYAAPGDGQSTCQGKRTPVSPVKTHSSSEKSHGGKEDAHEPLAGSDKKATAKQSERIRRLESQIPKVRDEGEVTSGVTRVCLTSDPDDALTKKKQPESLKSPWALPSSDTGAGLKSAILSTISGTSFMKESPTASAGVFVYSDSSIEDEVVAPVSVTEPSKRESGSLVVDSAADELQPTQEMARPTQRDPLPRDWPDENAEESAAGLPSEDSRSGSEQNSVRTSDDSATYSSNSDMTAKASGSPIPASVMDPDVLPLEAEENWTVADGFVLLADIAAGLYPHQKDGIKWLWKLHLENRGGILGDDMGLGKTRQVVSFLSGLFGCGVASRALLVVPTTLLPQWHLELASVGVNHCSEFSSSISLSKRASYLESFNDIGGVLLTTYEMTKDLKGAGISWDYLILDEGHLLRNPETKRFGILKTLSVGHCILLTGTPIQNKLKDIWALFDLCCSGLLGDYAVFKKRFENPIVSGSVKDASPKAKKLANETAKALREIIQPYLLRRLKRQIFPSRCDTVERPKELIPGRPPPLPRKTDLVVWLSLTKRQRQVYEGFLQTDLVRNTLNETQSPLAALSVLKKICDHPGLMTDNSMESMKEGLHNIAVSSDDLKCIAVELSKLFGDKRVLSDPMASCKLKFLKHLLECLLEENHHVLVFSQFKWMLDKVEAVLKKTGTAFLRIDGDVKPNVRQKRIEEFQSGNGPAVLLLTTKVGGVGLNLHTADRVVVLDPAWNPSDDNQSIDRAYRIGQLRDVIVYRLITCATVEEKIYGKQVMKDGLVRSATSDQSNLLRYFNEKDVSGALKMPRQGFSHCSTLEMMQQLHQTELSPDIQEHVMFLKESANVVGVSQQDLLYDRQDPTILGSADCEEGSRTGVHDPAPISGTSRKPLHQPSKHQINRIAELPKPEFVGKCTSSGIAERIGCKSQGAKENVCWTDESLL